MAIDVSDDDPGWVNSWMLHCGLSWGWRRLELGKKFVTPFIDVFTNEKSIGSKKLKLSVVVTKIYSSKNLVGNWNFKIPR